MPTGLALIVFCVILAIYHYKVVKPAIGPK
jgi:hypothetical protein